MKFPTDRPVKVVMLGAGGTGGYHMLDALKQFKGEVEVCIHLSSPHAPIVIDAAGRSDFALVVPVRLKEEMAA